MKKLLFQTCLSFPQYPTYLALLRVSRENRPATSDEGAVPSPDDLCPIEKTLLQHVHDFWLIRKFRLTRAEPDGPLTLYLGLVINREMIESEGALS